MSEWELSFCNFCGVWHQSPKVFFQKPSIVPLYCEGKVSCSGNGSCPPVLFLSTSLLAAKWNYFCSVRAVVSLCLGQSYKYSFCLKHHPQPFSPPNCQFTLQISAYTPVSTKVLPSPWLLPGPPWPVSYTSELPHITRCYSPCWSFPVTVRRVTIWSISLSPAPNSSGGLVAKPCPTLAAPGTVACQAPLSMGFSRPEYWSELPFPSPGDLPDPEIEPGSPALPADFFTNWATRESKNSTQISWTNEWISLTCESGLGGQVSLPTLICSNAARRTFWPWKGLGLFFFLFSCPSRCQSIFLLLASWIS